MTKFEKALLDVIAFTEGTLGVSQNGYDVVVGFYRIIGWTEDTSIVHGEKDWALSITSKNRKITSTAAGRYQFLGSTWKSVNGGNVPMTKDNQDKAAIKKINQRIRQTDLEGRSVKINQLVDRNKFDIMLNKLAREWASLPLSKTFTVNGVKRFAGSSYYSADGVNKSKHTPARLHEIYLEALNLYS